MKSLSQLSVLLACGSAAGRALRSSALLSVAGCSLLVITPLHAGIAENASRQKVAGIDVVALKTGVRDVVTIRGDLPAGDSRSPDTNSALADLAAGMLDKGTTKNDKFAISKQLGDVGANVSFGTNSAALNISAKCLRADLPLVLGLIAEQLRTPAFSPEEFAKLKKQLVGNIRRAMEDVDSRSDIAFNNAVFPLGHTNRRPATAQFLADVDKATLDEVKAFYQQYYGPAAMKLVIVGDVDPDAARGEVGKAFAGWTGGSPAPKAAKAGTVDAARDQNVFMAGKASVSVLWGQATQLRYGDPDGLALRIGTTALGSGFTGRLMANVRDKEGLTYGIYSAVTNDTYADGDWRIGAQFAPELLEKGLSSTRRQLAAWHKNGITEAELASNKGKYVGSYKLGLATTGGMADAILNTMNRDLPLSFIDEFGPRINSLTLAQVNGAIEKHLDPAKMILIKAGTVPGAMPVPAPRG
ncbi:MAG: insulinase family protein [Lacunisphaera sp.]|nr:insulinase family protein [Lacunisphaera sp.]